MNNNTLPIILSLILLIYSCNENETKYVLDETILAGQTTGNGIDYKDFIPDINCTIVQPWVKTDTIIQLDLNNDGEYDFSIKKTMCNPMFLGGDCEDITIIPLMNNEICVNAMTNWVDTLSYNDTIGIHNNWTNKESLIYSYVWVMLGETSVSGYWHKVKAFNQNYIGIKIRKDDKDYFGWIGMKSDSIRRYYDFNINDYAIIKEYYKE